MNRVIRRHAKVCRSLHAHYNTSLVQSYSTAPTSSLNIGVVGLGAVGTTFLGRLAGLAQTQHNSIDKVDSSLPSLQVDAFVKPYQIAKLQDGVKVWVGGQDDVPEAHIQADGSSAVRFRTIDELTADEPLDILLLAVKAFDSASLLQSLSLRPEATVVLLQNGFGQLPEGSRLPWQMAHGITYVSSRLTHFGEVIVSGQAGAVKTYIAPMDSESTTQETDRTTANLDALQRVLTAAKLPTEAISTDEMKSILWRKLFVNAGVNPVAALTDLLNEEVADSTWCRNCITSIIEEAAAVARSQKVDIPSSNEEIVEDVVGVARAGQKNVCSMLADIRAGRKTEIEALNGHIIDNGKKQGIPTPVNEFIFSLIKALEIRRMKEEETVV